MDEPTLWHEVCEEINQIDLPQELRRCHRVTIELNLDQFENPLPVTGSFKRSQPRATESSSGKNHVAERVNAWLFLPKRVTLRCCDGSKRCSRR